MLIRYYLSIVACVFLCCVGFICKVSASQISERDRGQELYLGKETLVGKIDGHTGALPAQLGKCVSCHTFVRQKVIQEEQAPFLNRISLLNPHARRGGPVSSYNKENFCNTVRTGIDPQYVTLRRAMPRYEISEVQCGALWTYLTDK